MNDDVRLAARNNSEWCDIICATHGIPTEFTEDAWASLRRSPPMYPDAVTLTAAAVDAAVLARMDSSRGASVKDSFAALHLSRYGFDVLFEAEWIHRPPLATRAGAGSEVSWDTVSTDRGLQEWAGAHGGGEVFRSALLDEPAVKVLAARAGGRLVGGLVAHRSGRVVGISNLFTTMSVDELWVGGTAAVSAWFPGLPLVGYEFGPNLTAARAAGYAAIGPLRVWVKG